MSNYTVIARKWRPQTFDDVVGQDHVVRTLRNAIRQDRIAQAYLLVGPRGTGKTTLARIFSKALNCEHGPTENPCGVCTACKEIAEGSSLDVMEIDGASNNKVEDVHNICANLQFASFSGKYRICYIDEVHMLSQAAFNALLKTLEEPPAHAKFIFATTEPDKILPTIVSRCQRFDLRRIPAMLIADRLRVICQAEGVNASEEALMAIARGADGGMRDAQSALDQLIAFRGNTLQEEDVLGVFGLVAGRALNQLAGAVLRNDVTTILSLIDEFDVGGKDLRRLVVDLVQHFRDLLVLIHTKGKGDGLDLTDAQRAVLMEELQGSSPEGVLKVVETLIELDEKIRMSLSRRTLLEAGLIRAARSATVTPLAEILRRVTSLQKELAAADGRSEVVTRILAAPAPVTVPPRPPLPSPDSPSTHRVEADPPRSASKEASQQCSTGVASAPPSAPPRAPKTLPQSAPTLPAAAPVHRPASIVEDSSEGELELDGPSDEGAMSSGGDDELKPVVPPPPNYIVIERPAVQAILQALGGTAVSVF